jgi:hypothetical protein
LRSLRRVQQGGSAASVLALAAAVLGLGCVHGERAWDAACGAALSRIAVRSAESAAERSQPAPRFLDWAALRNPILARPDRALKDAAVAYHEGEFFLLASTRFESGDPRVPSFYRSRDLRHFEEYGDPDLAASGLSVGSPDLTFDGEIWTLVFQSPPQPPGEGGVSARARVLYRSESRDLVDWSAPVEIEIAGLDRAERNIDGALARHGDRAVLGWKREQSFVVAESAGPWSFGRARPVAGELRFGPSSLSHAWAENFQFLDVDGAWLLIATARAPGLPFTRHVYTGSHETYLYQMRGRGDATVDWTRWHCKQHVEIPHEDWNRAMHANSGFLADWRAHDGHFYLFYAGSADHDRFEGRGHAAIGVARSRDLVHWSVPGASEAAR